MRGKKNYIYLFFEQVSADNQGQSLPKYKYFKCFHGWRKTYTISLNMKHSIKSKRGIVIIMLLAYDINS